MRKASGWSYEWQWHVIKKTSTCFLSLSHSTHSLSHSTLSLSHSTLQSHLITQAPPNHRYLSTNIPVFFGRRQQSSLQQSGFIFEAPATVISVTVPCIIVCSGSRTSKESLSAICWCGVEMWIGTGVTKTVVLLLNNLKGIKKHVEDISVDAVSGCEFCSALVIYNINYNTNNCIILTTVISTYHHYHSGDQLGSSRIHIMHVIPVKMSALPQ